MLMAARAPLETLVIKSTCLWVYLKHICYHIIITKIVHQIAVPHVQRMQYILHSIFYWELQGIGQVTVVMPPNA